MQITIVDQRTKPLGPTFDFRDHAKDRIQILFGARYASVTVALVDRYGGGGIKVKEGNHLKIYLPVADKLEFPQAALRHVNRSLERHFAISYLAADLRSVMAEEEVAVLVGLSHPALGIYVERWMSNLADDSAVWLIEPQVPAVTE